MVAVAVMRVNQVRRPHMRGLHRLHQPEQEVEEHQVAQDLETVNLQKVIFRYLFLIISF